MIKGVESGRNKEEEAAAAAADEVDLDLLLTDKISKHYNFTRTNIVLESAIIVDTLKKVEEVITNAMPTIGSRLANTVMKDNAQKQMHSQIN